MNIILYFYPFNYQNLICIIQAQRINNTFMPLFPITLWKPPNFGDNYKIWDMHHIYIKIERLRGKILKNIVIVSCTATCFQSVKYVSCGEPHNFIVCTNKDSRPKFLNCSGPYSADYRGCKSVSGKM